MSPHDYILSENTRAFLNNIICILFTIIYISVISFIIAITFNAISYKTALITIITLITIATLFFDIKNLEYVRKKYYFLFVFVFFVSLFFSSMILLWESYFSEYIRVSGMKVSNEDKTFFYNGEIFCIYAAISGIILISIDNYISTILFPYVSNNCNFKVDTVSNRFALDVLIFTIYLGILFGIIFYSFFYSEEKGPFFAGVNVTHIAIATVSVVTLFWAVKSIKSKSIELDMTRSREAGRLFSDGSLLLSAPRNEKKYIGLFYLNMIAGQSEGPLQKEAINLMADFILKANDVTTANKPRIRAMEYLSDRLKTDFWDHDIDQLIKLSSSELTESNQNYRFSQLNVIYENFNFSNDEKYLRYKLLEENKIIKKNEGIWSRLIAKISSKLTVYRNRKFFVYFEKLLKYVSFGLLSINNSSSLTDDNYRRIIAYNNCNFENFSGQNGIEKIILVYAQNCSFKKCKIGVVKGYSKKPKTWSNTGQKGESTPSNNKFERCDFSDSDGWNILRPSNRMEGEISETVAENAFINCFYYSGHEPKGFVKERDGALLTEITSKEQFDELIGSSMFMYYSPPDGKR